jgi:hypothetical protein
VNLRRTLAKLVGGAPPEDLAEEAVEPPTPVDEDARPAGSAGAPSGDLAITFTLVERPRDDQ